MIHNISCLDYLYDLKRDDYTLIFADPPDNLGLDYGAYNDSIPLEYYYSWLRNIIDQSLRIAPIVWLSYYWKHDLTLKHHLYYLLNHRYKNFTLKNFIWRYTFGQHNSNDCGSGFRFLARFTRYDAVLYPDSVRETSIRQLLGDERANPAGRVPDDVWDVPRIVGNSHERRSWHPTQHPEDLLTRIVKLSTVQGDKVLDLFGGTGTTLRVCKRLGRICDTCEIDPEYVTRISKENADETRSY